MHGFFTPPKFPQTREFGYPQRAVLDWCDDIDRNTGRKGQDPQPQAGAKIVTETLEEYYLVGAEFDATAPKFNPERP